MPSDNLGIPQRAALFALMAEAREVSNTELEKLAGFRLTGRKLRALRDRQLVESHRPTTNGPFLHRLTDDGWKWCAAELAAGPPARAGSAGGALYAVLAGLGRYLARANLDLHQVFGQPDDRGGPDLPERIRIAYRKLARDPQDLVSLTRLRPLLGDAPKDEVDVALRQLSRSRQANLVPQENQKTLSVVDREAAVRIGNEDCHLISVSGS